MYVYAIETPAYVKIGHWSGSISALQARYATSIPFFETTVFQTSHSVDAERKLHRECQPFHLRGEMFSRDALPAFYSAAASLGEIFCTSSDLEKKKTACLKAQNKKLLKEIAALRKANDKMTIANETLTIANENLTIANENLKEHNKQLVKEVARRDRIIHSAESKLSEAILPHPDSSEARFASWLDSHIVTAPDKRIHAHRFEKAFNRGMAEENQVNSRVANDILTAKGITVSRRGDNQKDKKCCTGSARWVMNVDVKTEDTHDLMDNMG